MLRRLLHRFRTRRPYRIFTADYDQEIRASDLLAQLDAAGAPRVSMEQPTALRQAMERVLAGPSVSSLTFTVDDRIVVLVDHSGSMKGAPIAMASAIAEALADFFDLRGVPCEVLGYTTRNWRGGRSRQRWVETGRPAKPGRLCDLRHLIYRSYGETGDGWRAALRLMGADILREGVDGEAVEWAVTRVAGTPPRGRRMIIHLGDASPVDDSTQQANGMWILEDHFLEATQRIRSDGVRYVMATFRLWQVDIPQVCIPTDPAKCALAVGEALRALFIPTELSEADSAQPQA